MKYWIQNNVLFIIIIILIIILLLSILSPLILHLPPLLFFILSHIFLSSILLAMHKVVSISSNIGHTHSISSSILFPGGSMYHVQSHNMSSQLVSRCSTLLVYITWYMCNHTHYHWLVVVHYWYTLHGICVTTPIIIG